MLDRASEASVYRRCFQVHEANAVLDFIDFRTTNILTLQFINKEYKRSKQQYGKTEKEKLKHLFFAL